MAEIGRRKGDGSLLAALAAGATVRDAAMQAGISERTATRRMADPAFRGMVARLRANMIERALGKLSKATTGAVVTLRRLLNAQGESVRLGAARTILELSCRLRESVELEQRIKELEEQLNAQHTTTAEQAGQDGSAAVKPQI